MEVPLMSEHMPATHMLRMTRRSGERRRQSRSLRRSMSRISLRSSG
jgi:hypothetical protein